MKFTFGWLKEHLETDRPLPEIVETLSMIGLEVEGVDDRAESLSGFRVAHVVSARRHPDADRLQVCMVDDGGGEPIQVVCGAPNARSGMKGVFAPAGSHIPGTGITLRKSSIRGQESNGMLLSEREMGLSDDHEGIVELSDDARIGTPAADYLGLCDPVIDVALTPNRPDCAGVRGIARDLAAAGLGQLKPLDAPEIDGTFDSPIQWQRDLPEDASNACPLVIGRMFRNLRNGESPAWLKERLNAVGLRPISALVDITNYVSIDLARPLHVFDADQLSGDLVMRLAKKDESILALDGNDYRLQPSMTVISDSSRVQGIGGVMGGAFSGCSETTSVAFLEVALFDPVRTANTGRMLDILSDARYRFERGVDPESAFWGAHVATRLILELCGGEASRLTMAGTMPDWRREVVLRKSRAASLGGLDVSGEDQVRILGALGFDPRDSGDGLIRTCPPSWRPDIDGEADLVEEVLRIRGYNDIPVMPLQRETSVSGRAWSPVQKRIAVMRRALASRGMVEAVTFSFMKRETAEKFGFSSDSLRIDNPISADLDVMRPSILPNLLEAAKRNAARGYRDIALFEVGPEYVGDDEAGQLTVAAGIRVGNCEDRIWLKPTETVSLWDVKADVLTALEAVGAPVANLQVSRDAPGWFHPGRSGVFRLGKTVIASFGDLHPGILGSLDMQGPASAFAINLDNIPLPRSRAGGSKRSTLQLAPLQPVSRDLAFVVDSGIAASDILQAAKSADRTLITNVGVFDVFEGGTLGDNRKSVAISLTLQPTQASLTDEQINALMEKVARSVEKRTGGVLRG